MTAALDWVELAAREFERPTPEQYLARPDAWVNDRLGEHLWSKQIEIVESVRDRRRTAVQSCHGVGKSFIASRLTAWWLDAHPVGTARVVTTAPTGAQVKAILWAEINGAAHKARARGHPFRGVVNQTEWMLDNQLVAFGRKPSDYNQHAFQGIHAKFVLVVIDEACGVGKHFWTAANSIATGEHCRILAIGNPDDPGSYFATVCTGGDWNRIEISVFDSPNFTGEPVPTELAENLVSLSYEREIARDFGESSPIYLSKVLGRFPQEPTDGVVRLSKLLACCRPPETPYEPERLTPVELGVDVGAGGDDEAAIRERRGIMVGREWRTRTRDSEELVDLIVEAVKETGASAVKVDVIGVGWGVVGSLRRRRAKGEHGAQVVGVNVGEASAKPDRYLRLRSQLWWEVGRGLSEDRGWDLSGLEQADRDRLVTQLTAPKYSLDASRRIVVEKKDETKKRLGRSPDNADALLLAFYGGSGQGPAFLAAMKARAQAAGITVETAARDWRATTASIREGDAAHGETLR
ncbi:MAG TPA: hypothetical protein VN088_19100 [Nocardioides sp.]|nr:hypothetical protein [Nocardioides sp.]